MVFIHDFSAFAESARVDQVAIEAISAALSGSDKPLVVTSGVLGLPPGRLGTEDDAPLGHGLRKSEAAALTALQQGVRAMVVRLPPSVHGDGDHGFVPALIAVARERGFVPYVGDGENRWPAVHRLDAATLYRLALEKGTAGARFHGIAEEGIPVRLLADVIGRRLNVPSVAKTPAEASELLGFIGHVLALDARASSALTRERIGWQTTQRGLLDDLEQGSYFDA